MTATAGPEQATPAGGAHPAGLTAAEAAERLATYGPNTVPAPRRRGVAWRAARQLRAPMLLLLPAVLCRRPGSWQPVASLREALLESAGFEGVETQQTASYYSITTGYKR